MSDHLAIAGTTAALGRLLQDALDVDVPGAQVSHERPGGPGDDSRVGVNIFLFQVTPNAALRNLDLPTRDGGGRRRQRPVAALDLHYLLTFYGSATTFEPERILGATVRRLHERPVLDRELVRDAVGDPVHAAVLGGSDLADAAELIKLAPTPLNLEELSKLWSILFQTAYRLSAAYRATVVQIEAREDAAAAVPVRRRGGWVLPVTTAEIRAIEAAAGPGAPILWGGRLVVRGRGLDVAGAVFSVDGVDAVVDAAVSTGERVEIELQSASFDGATLAAGVALLRMKLPPPSGAPAHLAREVAAAPFLLRPTLMVDSLSAGAPDAEGRHDGTLTLTLSPPVAEGQEVRAVLDRTAPRPSLTRVLEPTLPPATVFPVSTVAFPFEALGAGSWLVRVRVDGAESPHAVENDPADPAFGTITGPMVSVP